MKTIRKWVLDIFFPRKCLGCASLLREEALSYVCAQCLKKIPLAAGFACAFCNSPVRAGKTCPYCVRNHSLDHLLVTSSYENPLVEKIVKTLKYRFVASLAEDMAGLMARYLKKKAAWLVDTKGIIVVPVPLHYSRLNWRGFNQAEIIGSNIAKSFDWQLATDAIKRICNQKPQADMPDRLSRIKNMHKAFKCTSSDSLINKAILLIDDVSATGSTLNDCARALKDAGARQVIGFVFARGRLNRKTNGLV